MSPNVTRDNVTRYKFPSDNVPRNNVSRDNVPSNNVPHVTDGGPSDLLDVQIVAVYAFYNRLEQEKQISEFK